MKTIKPPVPSNDVGSGDGGLTKSRGRLSNGSSRRLAVLGLVGLFGHGTIHESFSQSALKIGSVPGYPGAASVVPVAAVRLTNFTAVQFDLTFDPTKASVGAPSKEGSFSGHIVVSRLVAPGVRRVLAYSLANRTLSATNSQNLTKMSVGIAGEQRSGFVPLSFGDARVVGPEGSLLNPVALTPGAVFVRPVDLAPDGSTRFFLASVQNQEYFVQATTNLSDWVNISTNLASGEFMDLVDFDSRLYPHRFYRLIPSSLVGGSIAAVSGSKPGEYVLSYPSILGKEYSIQSSTNLSDWTEVVTIVSKGSSVRYTNEIQPQVPWCFFRVLELP